MRTNLRGLARQAALVVCLAAAAVAGCGKPGNSEPSFKLNTQGLDPDDFRLVGDEKTDADKERKKFNEKSRQFLVDALEAMFGTPDRPYVFPESGLDLEKIFMASGPVGGLPQAEIEAQIIKFRQQELEVRRELKEKGLEQAAKEAGEAFTKLQTETKPVQDRLSAAQKALAEAEKAKNQAEIDRQKALVEAARTELKPFTDAQAAKAKADAELAGYSDRLKDLSRQVNVWNKKQLGLYRQHCAHCHGTTGDGAGPTALFLTPYPRDYRQGIFKFKSTERAAKPSDADLRRILVDGIPDTAMPTVGLLPPDQIDALVEYVKYLSIRGEAEVAIRSTWVDDRNEMRPSRTELISVGLQTVVDSWKEANEKVIKPLQPYQEAKDAWKKSVEEKAAEESAKTGKPVVAQTDENAWLREGAVLFGGQKGQCYTCHGTTGLGDGRKLSEPLFDDWNKPKKFADTRKRIEEAKAADKPEVVRNLTNILHSWQLPEQNQFPRNLRLGRFRFGRAPVDLYRRIHAGITGTEMPGGGPPEPGQQAKLTPVEIWQLVDYVLLLPYLDPSGRLEPSGGHHAAGTHHASSSDHSSADAESQ